METFDFYWITFFGEGEDPIKITSDEYKQVAKTMNQEGFKFVFIRGEAIAISLIKRITPIRKEQVSLPEPTKNEGVSADFLEKHKAEMVKRFTPSPQIVIEEDKIKSPTERNGLNLAT